MRYPVKFIAVGTLLAIASSSDAVVPVASNEPGALTLQQMAEVIADEVNSVAVMAESANSQIAGSNESSAPAAIASFTHGNTTPQGTPIVGTLLPPANRDASNPNASYSGGLGIENGVCLTTGFASDSAQSGPVGRGIGVQGPNNGFTPFFANPGEVSVFLNLPDDSDFAAALSLSGGDASVLTFSIEIDSPGFLRISFVHATDEFPAWKLEGFNDSTAIFIDGKNIVLFRSVEDGAVIESPLSLFDLADCGEPLFKTNQISPAPDVFDTSDHRVPGGTQFYDHEFAGFSKVLTRETSVPLAIGTHTVKIVIQDVGDTTRDSAVFIGQDSLKLFPLHQGDYNGNGVVDAADYVVFADHFNQTPATFYDGDGSGNCVVSYEDYFIWRANFGYTGNADLSADYNRDGCVDILDRNIWRGHFGMTECASRFEGDANGDGAVDAADDVMWRDQEGQGNCGGGSFAMAVGDGESPAAIRDRLPKSPDMNGDGSFDEADIPLLTNAVMAAVYGDVNDDEAAGEFQATATPEPTTDLLEPEPELASPADEASTAQGPAPFQSPFPVLPGAPPEFPAE